MPPVRSGGCRGAPDGTRGQPVDHIGTVGRAPTLSWLNPNEVIRRRTDYVGVFADRAAVIRLVGAVPARADRRMGRALLHGGLFTCP